MVTKAPRTWWVLVTDVDTPDYKAGSVVSVTSVLPEVMPPNITAYDCGEHVRFPNADFRFDEVLRKVVPVELVVKQVSPEEVLLSKPVWTVEERDTVLRAILRNQLGGS